MLIVKIYLVIRLEQNFLQTMQYLLLLLPSLWCCRVLRPPWWLRRRRRKRAAGASARSKQQAGGGRGGRRTEVILPAGCRTAAAPADRVLALYVNGVLERPSDGSIPPLRPSVRGHEPLVTCEAGSCEEGMHVGGFYCCGGGGFTGAFFHGLIDEVRVWRRAGQLGSSSAAPGGMVVLSRCNA